MQPARTSIWSHDSNETASGKPGTLHIELDGGQHSESRDAARSELIEAHGYRVIRFWNNDVMDNLEGVLETIVREIRIAQGL